MIEIYLENDKTKIVFAVENDTVTVRRISFFGVDYISYPSGMQHSYVFLVGKVYTRKILNRYGVGGETLSYKGHRLYEESDRKRLTIAEENEFVRVMTTYMLYNDSATLECKKEVENVSEETLVLECVSPLTLKGVMPSGAAGKVREADENEDPTTHFETAYQADECGDGLPYLWRVNNTWCSEGNFERLDLAKEGLRAKSRRARYNKIVVGNNGTMTTNRFFPFGMLEKAPYGYFAFEILPEGGWCYEIETGIFEWDEKDLLLALTGKTLGDSGWSKTLKSGETYQTERVRIVGSSEMETVCGELLKARRKGHRKHNHTPYESVIYNGFMHNCWDHPTEATDEKNIPVVAERGADYYVIDAGWHDRGEGISPTIETGEWRENPLNYPSGLQKTIDKVRARGMKFGFWVELQSVGVHCKNKDLLPEHCFFHVNGVRPVCNNRWQVDYSQKETREWASNTIDRLIKTYKPDYIKIDYNQTQTANDCRTGNPAEGVCRHFRAYSEWFERIQDRYPEVLFETCSSGGMLMDANSAEKATVFSISDCNDCYAYPSMIGNLATLLMPEQMGVWCMPVPSATYPNTTDERVVTNVVNALYYSMHLATKMENLTDAQKSLLDEGIAYYKRLASAKKKASPVLPKGPLAFDDETPVFGLKTDKKLYLAVYDLSDEPKEVTLDLRKYKATDCTLAYPNAAVNEYALENGFFRCKLQAKTARAFEFTIET